MPDSAEQDCARISELIRGMTQAWTTGQWEDLAEFFHADIVMEFPDFSAQTVGRAAMVDGFKEFCESAELHEFEESEVRVNVVGSTAVASYAFDTTFERDGRKYHGTGRDLWVLTKTDGKWQAVWRTMLDINEQVI